MNFHKNKTRLVQAYVLNFSFALKEKSQTM